MNIDEQTYIDVTPRDLWRLGTKNSPRLDKPRIPPRPGTVDIQTYTNNGEPWVKAGAGGISTFDKINLRLNGDHWWKIPAGTQIPVGLKVTKNHTDRSLGVTHYRIEPKYDMPLSQFIKLLAVVSEHAQSAWTGNAFNKRRTPSES
jgi:hypothetical protein